MTLTAQSTLEYALSVHGPRIALVDGERSLSYSALAERSARLANVLLAYGAGKVRPALGFLPNRSEFVEFDVACTRAGITRIGVSERLSSDECCRILEHAGVAVLVTTEDLLARLDGLIPGDLEAVLVVQQSSTDGRRPHSKPVRLGYEHALADARSTLTHIGVAPHDPNYVLYTSGTSGRPKGATHSHAGRISAMLNMLASELALDSKSVMVHAAPLSHGSGSKVIAFLATGGKSAILRRFTPESFAGAIREQGGTHTFLVPTMIHRLLEAGPEVVASMRLLQQISFGGSPIAPSLFERAIDEFGPILTQIYGSAEAPHPVTVLRPSDYCENRTEQVLLSAGRAALGVELRVIDESGRTVPDGTAGELAVRAPHLMTSYWGDEDATSAAFMDDRWYKSRDLVTRDAGGLITFHDRKDDLIISGGLNIYPSEIERVLAEHPGVREVVALGYPDEVWGESVVAYVVPAANNCSADELAGWVQGRLASYKKPRRIEFVEHLPLGATEKVLRQNLREGLWDGHSRRVH